MSTGPKTRSEPPRPRSAGIMRNEDNTYSTNEFIVWTGGATFASAGIKATINIHSAVIHTHTALEDLKVILTGHKYPYIVITCPLEIQLLGLNEQYDKALKEAMRKG